MNEISIFSVEVSGSYANFKHLMDNGTFLILTATIRGEAKEWLPFTTEYSTPLMSLAKNVGSLSQLEK